MCVCSVPRDEHLSDNLGADPYQSNSLLDDVEMVKVGEMEMRELLRYF